MREITALFLLRISGLVASKIALLKFLLPLQLVLQKSWNLAQNKDPESITFFKTMYNQTLVQSVCDAMNRVETSSAEEEGKFMMCIPLRFKNKHIVTSEKIWSTSKEALQFIRTNQDISLGKSQIIISYHTQPAIFSCTLILELANSVITDKTAVVILIFVFTLKCTTLSLGTFHSLLFTSYKGHYGEVHAESRKKVRSIRQRF